MAFKVGDKVTLYFMFDLDDTYEPMLPFLVTTIVEEKNKGDNAKWMFEGGYSAYKSSSKYFCRAPRNAPKYLEYRKYKAGDEERIATVLAFKDAVQNTTTSLKLLCKKYASFLRLTLGDMGDLTEISTDLLVSLQEVVDAGKPSKG
jgi:hypothetical protein